MRFFSLISLVFSLESVEQRTFNQILSSIPVPEYQINLNGHKGKSFSEFKFLKFQLYGTFVSKETNLTEEKAIAVLKKFIPFSMLWTTYGSNKFEEIETLYKLKILFVAQSLS